MLRSYGMKLRGLRCSSVQLCHDGKYLFRVRQGPRGISLAVADNTRFIYYNHSSSPSTPLLVPETISLGNFTLGMPIGQLWIRQSPH
jgi:hypothetical protein